jgi:hypothetical protein
MTQQRLPIVNSDDGAWGDILNQYLTKEHYDSGVDNAANGGHKNITIQAGTTAAGTAPLKFTSGSLTTAAEAGAVEFLTDKLYLTQTTNTTRKVIAAYDDSSGATGDVYYRDSSNNFVRLGIGSSTQVLTVSGGSPALPTWAPSTAGFGVETIGITIDGGGAVITTGSKGFKYIQENCTVTGWTLIGKESGSCVIDVKKCNYAGFPSTTSIAGTEKPTLTSAQNNQDQTLTTWTASLSAGDILEFVVNSVATITRVSLFINISK